MRSIRNRRLWAAGLALAGGGAFAAANAVGHAWAAVVLVPIVFVPVAVVNYVRAGRDSDRAAMMIGGGADERQALIRTQARALWGAMMYAAAVISCIAVIALRGIGHWSSWWPIGLVVAVGTVAYVWSGRACGLGALIGGRADERQALIRTRARALAGYAMVAPALIGVLVEVALGDTFRSYWPFCLVGWAGAVGYLAGETKYGAAHGADYAPGADNVRGRVGAEADR
jgi:hypothetical protein